MITEIIKCRDCVQPMLEIGGIGKNIQVGEYRKQENSQYSIWHQTGIREIKLYQCPKCKEVKID